MLRGRIAPGMSADVVILGADPILSVQAFSRVHFTIRGGRVIYTAQSGAAMDVEVELKDMQQRLLRALLGGRRDEYASMLAPEWRVTHIDGQILTKAQVLEMMFGKEPSPLADGSIDDVEVRVFGDTAVVPGRTTAVGRDGARVVLRFSDFAVRRKGRWQIVASHATALP